MPYPPQPMRTIALLAAAIALAGCGHKTAAVTYKTCDDGTRIATARALHAWTAVEPGAPLPGPDDPVWHVGTAPDC